MQAFLDAEESEAPRSYPAQYLVDGKPNPVVLEEAVHYPTILPQLELDLRRRGMFGDVGHAFLHDAVEGRFDSRRQPSWDPAVHANKQPRARSDPFGKEPDSGHEP
jgi:hypothetical protein